MRYNFISISFSFIFSFLSINLFAQYGPQFDNRGFEQWTTRDEYSASEPVHWHSGGTATGSFSGFLSSQIEQSTQLRPGSSGSKSVRIYPSSLLGITANGTVTNGRINAGSMSATGSGNYNYTQRAENAFNTPISQLPDSLTIWVCFRSQSTTDKAQVKVVVHGDADYKLIGQNIQTVSIIEDTFTVNVSANPNDGGTVSGGGSYNYGASCTLTATANEGYGFVEWTKDGVQVSTDASYTFIVTASETYVAHFQVDDAVEDHMTASQIFPNPFTSVLSIATEQVPESIRVYDIYGRLLKEQTVSAMQFDLDLSGLAKGTYLLQINYGNSRSVHRIMKAE